MLRQIYIALLILTVAINADNKNKKLEFSYSEYESDFKYSMPIDERQHWKIDFGYHSEDLEENENMTEREGKIGTTTEKKNYFFSTTYNWNFQNGAKLSLGGDYEHFENRMGEWGMYEESVKGSMQSLSFKNDIDIEGDRFSVSLGAGYGNQYFNTDLTLRGTPKEKFDMTQSTQVFPVLMEGGELESTATLDTSYKISGEVFTADNLLGNFKIGADYSYETIPFSYQVKRIKSTDYNEFIIKDIEYDEETTKYNLIGIMKFQENTYFNLQVGEIKNEQKREKGTITQKEQLITAGIEIWF